jgi:hypothetical protein
MGHRTGTPPEPPGILWVRRERSPSLLLGVLAAGAVLAACGGGSTSTSRETQSVPLTRSGSTAPSAGSTEAIGPHHTPASPLSEEEMREYDANEGRCADDGGVVRNVGTVDAYCAFGDRSNDFHLIESAQGPQPSGEEE